MEKSVEVKNVSVKYLVGDFKNIGLKDYIIKKLKGTYSCKGLWANKNISFTLNQGDMLGIVGLNGAGKSTLLTAISGILEPVSGSIKTNGKVVSLLELTAGFDPDLPAKDNAYLRGAMLGYTEEFMDEMYDSIIEFAELQDYQDMPLRQYSSGMRARLAFSIACQVKPDILIIDEVLSVGDGAFRKKSREKIMEVLQSGVTGIIVSHSLDIIRHLCNKVLWIDQGRQVCFTNQCDVCLNAYEEYYSTKILPTTKEELIEMSNSYLARNKSLNKFVNK